MNNQTVYWVWLQLALGYANNKILSVISQYTFAEDFYRAPLTDKLSCGCFTIKDRKALADLSLDEAFAIIDRCKRCGVDIVTMGDADYPEMLSEISAPPVVLYVKGDTGLLNDNVSIAIVGTRSATAYGQRTAFDFGYNLAKNKAVVVSGGAMGVDSFAHRGAVQAGGKTICVLGCGIEYNYLMKNKDMRDAIADKGLLMSEYPPDYPPTRFTFPARNRIISGLAKGVLVVEAGERSGSLITANLALEQNRDVFAVPGNIGSSVSFGTNRLIKMGAKPVTDVTDILCEYMEGESFIQENSPKNMSVPFEKYKDNFKEKKNNVSTVKQKGVDNSSQQLTLTVEKEAANRGKISEDTIKDLSSEARKIIELFFKEKKLHIDSITEQTGFSVSTVQAAVTELEMNDFISSLQGRMYELV